MPAPRLTVVPSQSDGSGTEPAGPPTTSAEPTIRAEMNTIGTGGQGSLPWVLPVDGECPEGYPVKANDNSGIYHVPNGRFYARTKAERCYIDAESAAADGYRAAKA